MKFFKPASLEPLVVSMTGVRMGDRLLVIGGIQPQLIAQLAAKPGLTGRMCAVDESADLAAKAAETAQKEGALVEVETAPFHQLPFESGTFDVVVVNRVLGRLDEARRDACLREAARVLRDGGRCVVIGPGRPSGIGAWFWKPTLQPADIERFMQSVGFRAVHTLAEREAMIFVEGARR
jgi:ubiquinone/menaquinone biosynthesis C-methylase UbiE